MAHESMLTACGPYTEEPLSCHRNRINSLPVSQPYLLLSDLGVSDLGLLDERRIESVQSSDVIFGVVAFLGCLQAFILADRKTGVLFIPDFYGPSDGFFFERWQLDIYNGIIEIK